MKIDKYPIPKTCVYCNGKVSLISNAFVYGREYGNGLCYFCEKCNCYVGVHNDKVTPLGVLANNTMRLLKKRCHSTFDPLWQSGKITRNNAYSKLAKRLNIPLNECHFGWFDEPMLKRALKQINQMVTEL